MPDNKYTIAIYQNAVEAARAFVDRIKTVQSLVTAAQSFAVTVEMLADEKEKWRMPEMSENVADYLRESEERLAKMEERLLAATTSQA